MRGGPVSQATIYPGALSGEVPAIASKSYAHRLLILAALADAPTEIACDTTSADIEATASCLRSLGATVVRTHHGFRVTPLPREGCVPRARAGAQLDCGESGSTLRFMLPVVAALGRGASLTGHGRLAKRPLSPLYEELQAHGATLSPQGEFPLEVSGALWPGRFWLPGDVSSQYVTGLLLAGAALGSPMDIFVSEPVESRGYIDVTMDTLATFGVPVEASKVEASVGPCLRLSLPGQTPATPGEVEVEGDWSNAAFWLAAGALSPEGCTVTGLNLSSRQGDRAALVALAILGARIRQSGGSAGASLTQLRGRTVDVSGIPDLVPPLAAVAAYASGTTTFTGAGRLRLKESNRLETIRAAIVGMGGWAEVDGDALVVQGRRLSGGVVDAANDHRIAMMAAVAATQATGPTTIRDSGCVAKSYPAFFADFARLGGHVEESED